MHYNCWGFPLLAILLFVSVTWQLLGWGNERKMWTEKGEKEKGGATLTTATIAATTVKRGTKGTPRGNSGQKEFCPWSTMFVCVCEPTKLGAINLQRIT